MNNWRVLDKIDKICNQIKYQSIHIEIKTASEIYTLDKDKLNPIGFMIGDGT